MFQTRPLAPIDRLFLRFIIIIIQYVLMRLTHEQFRELAWKHGLAATHQRQVVYEAVKSARQYAQAVWPVFRMKSRPYSRRQLVPRARPSSIRPPPGYASKGSMVRPEASGPLTMIRQNPDCLNHLGSLPKTSHKKHRTEPSRVARSNP